MMKNLTNAALAIFVCLWLLTLVSCSVPTKSMEAESESLPAPTKTVEAANSKKDEKPSGETSKCDDNDEDCFIRAAKVCRPATLTNNKVQNFGSDEFSQSVYYEIKGGNSEECKFYLKILNWEVKPVEMSEEEKEKTKKELIEKGWTVTEKSGEQIKESEERRKAMEKRMRDHVGTDGVCTFTASKLAALFERWKDGRFSSEDYKAANCQGTYFSKENGF